MRARLLMSVLLAGCAPAGPPPSAPAPAEARPERAATDDRTVVRLGVLLPPAGEGYVRQYADGVLEGVQVAVEQRSSDPRFRVELVVREGGAAAGVRALAEAGAVAIIAPLAEAQVAAAAAARPDGSLAIISPTAVAPFRQLSQVYALNVPDTLGAAALGEHAARSGLAPAAVLRARDPASLAQARAFMAAYTAAGGRPPLELSYSVGTTTFGPLLRRLKEAGVRAIFLAADERDIRQVVPQVGYYGLEATQLLATGGWATPDGLERIGRNTLDGVLVTLPFLPQDSGGGWQQFERAYEEQFRRSLPSPIPALGYDAARLALAGLGRRGTAAEVAASLAAGNEVAAATGRLLPSPGGVWRRPFVVRVQDGALLPVATAR